MYSRFIKGTSHTIRQRGPFQFHGEEHPVTTQTQRRTSRKLEECRFATRRYKIQMFPGPHFVSLRKAPAWRETAGDIPEWSEPWAVCPHSTHRDPEETTNSRGLGNTPVHGGRLRGALHHGDATGLMENKTHHLPEGSTHKRLYRLRFRLPCGFFLQRHREIDIFVFCVKCFNNYWTGRRLNFGTKRNAPFRMNWI